MEEKRWGEVVVGALYQKKKKNLPMARYQGPGLPAQVSLPCRGCNPEIIQEVLCIVAGLILWLRLWTDRQGKMGGQIQRRTLSSLSTNTALEHGTQPPTGIHGSITFSNSDPTCYPSQAVSKWHCEQVA